MRFLSEDGKRMNFVLSLFESFPPLFSIVCGTYMYMRGPVISIVLFTCWVTTWDSINPYLTQQGAMR